MLASQARHRGFESHHPLHMARQRFDYVVEQRWPQVRDDFLQYDLVDGSEYTSVPEGYDEWTVGNALRALLGVSEHYLRIMNLTKPVIAQYMAIVLPVAAICRCAVMLLSRLRTPFSAILPPAEEE